MTVESDWTAVKGSLSLTRVLFPSVDEAAFCEKYILKNTGEKPLYVEIPRARSVIRTAPAKGVEGSYELVAEICGDTALMLAPRAEVAFGAFFSVNDFRVSGFRTRFKIAAVSERLMYW